MRYNDVPALGASAAVNAIVVFNILLMPQSTILLFGIVPMPAWLLGVGWLVYDLSGAYRVRFIIGPAGRWTRLKGFFCWVNL